MDKPRFAAAVLAAGLSTRMNEFKPLLPLGDTTITDYVISTFRNISIDVFLVAGYRREDIVSHIKDRPFKIVYNPDYEKGMFSSIQAAARELGKEYRGFLMLPVDIPLVRAGTIKQIISAAAGHPDRIIYPVFQGKRGHPPLVPASLIPGILKWDREGGLKTFLASHEELALDIPVDDRFILFDVDTPKDYAELLKQYKSN